MESFETKKNEVRKVLEFIYPKTFRKMEIDITQLMSRFKVFSSDTLFDIEKDEMFLLLKENRCLKCGNKLKFMRNGKMAYCRSVKHKKAFVISVQKLNHINGK